MTIKGSGSSLSMSEIDAEFGRGKNLNSYRGTTWWKDDFTTGTFSSGSISISDFYSKRLTSPIPSAYLIGMRYTGTRWQSFRSYDGGTTTVDLGLLPTGTSTPYFVVSNGTTIVLGDSLSNLQVKVSTDSGVSWSAYSVPSPGRYWGTAQYGNGYFVVTGGSQNSTWAMYSSNGTTWTDSTMPYTGFWNALTYTPQGFWAVNQSGYQSYSLTGSTWTPAGRLTLPAGASTSVVDCVYANGYYMVLTVFGTNGTQILRSSEGTNWSTIVVSTTYKGQRLSYVGSGTWIISSESNNNQIARSTDNGSTWTLVTLPNGNNYANAGKIITDSLGNSYTNNYTNNYLYKSTNGGASWTSVTSPSQYGFYMATAGSGGTSSTWK